MEISFTGLRAAMKATLAAVFPPQCPGCGAAIAEEGGLCPACWRDTEFIGPCACGHCGAPLPGGGGPGVGGLGVGWLGVGGIMQSGADLTCDDCLAMPRPWLGGRAALVYAGAGRRMVLALKHADRVDLAPVLGRWLARAAEPLVQPDMIVVPVPVHPRRLMARKYNQAALLGAQVARAHHLPLRAGALIRTRHTPMQDHGSVRDRIANVAGALAVPPGMSGAIAGRPVLLIDDVMTSGATLAAAAAALTGAGSGPVAVAVLARAIRAGQPFVTSNDPD